MITKKCTDRIFTNEDNQHLLQMGWAPHFQTQLENFCSKEFIPARVVGVRKNKFRISNGKREWLATVSNSVGKGKHTTTSRDLIMMPQGGMVIDNPGIREIALWNDDDGIDTAFPEIEHLAYECRFSDCSHIHEPGCRVLQAVTEGEILQNRLQSYQKMKRELIYLSSRQQKSADRVEKEQWKEVALKIKAINKRRRNG